MSRELRKIAVRRNIGIGSVFITFVVILIYVTFYNKFTGHQCNSKKCIDGYYGFIPDIFSISGVPFVLGASWVWFEALLSKLSDRNFMSGLGKKRPDEDGILDLFFAAPIIFAAASLFTLYKIWIS